jgi:hypothetical protein
MSFARNEAIKDQYVHSKNYNPPEDIGSSFYPMRGIVELKKYQYKTD